MIEKKIAFFIPEIDIGGVEMNTLNLSKSIKAEFDESYLIFLRNKNNDLKSRFSKAFNLVQLEDRRMLLMYFSFKNFIEQYRPNYLVISSYMHLIILIFLKKTLFKDLKVIFKIETNLEISLRNQSIIDYFLFKITRKFILSNCNLILSSCKAIQDSIVQDCGARNLNIRTLYNPVTETNPKFSKQTKKLHRFFHEKPSDGIVFISIGRLVESKGFKELIIAFKKLLNLKLVSSAKLIIIGEGLLKLELSKLINSEGLQNDIEIINFNEYFKDYIAMSDVYISNSFHEGLNNNLVHALSEGVKIISTDCNFGPREILLDGKLGELIKPKDESSLIKSMENAIRNNDEIPVELMSSRAKDFSIEIISSKFLALIDSV